jgi:hypothetical protein
VHASVEISSMMVSSLEHASSLHLRNRTHMQWVWWSAPTGSSGGHVGRDINCTPKVIGHVEKGTGWFRASISVARCSIGLEE